MDKRMRDTTNICKNKNGFTLIEIVSTLLIISIACALFASYFTNTISNSSLPVIILRNHYGSSTQPDGLVSIMEQMTFDYKTNSTKFFNNLSDDAYGDTNTAFTLNEVKLEVADTDGDYVTDSYYAVKLKKSNGQSIVGIFPRK